MWGVILQIYLDLILDITCAHTILHVPLSLVGKAKLVIVNWPEMVVRDGARE